MSLNGLPLSSSVIRLFGTSSLVILLILLPDKKLSMKTRRKLNFLLSICDRLKLICEMLTALANSPIYAAQSEWTTANFLLDLFKREINFVKLSVCFAFAANWILTILLGLLNYEWHPLESPRDDFVSMFCKTHTHTKFRSTKIQPVNWEHK